MNITKHCNLLYYKDFYTASNFSPKFLRFKKKLIFGLSRLRTTEQIATVGPLKKFKFTTKGATVKLVWPCPDTENRLLCHWPVIAMGFVNSPTVGSYMPIVTNKRQDANLTKDQRPAKSIGKEELGL